MHVRLCFLDFSLIPKDVLFCSRVSFSVSKSHHQCFSFCKKTGVGVTLEYHLWPPDGRRSLDVVRKQRKHPGPAGLPQIVPHGATWNPPRCQHPSWTTVAVGSPPLAEFWQPAQVVQQARGAGFWTLCLFILFEFWLKSSSVGPVCPNSLSCAPTTELLPLEVFVAGLCCEAVHPCGLMRRSGSFIESVTSRCRGIYPHSQEVPWSKTGPFPVSAAWNKLPYTWSRLIALNLTEHVFHLGEGDFLVTGGFVGGSFLCWQNGVCAGFRVVIATPFASLCVMSMGPVLLQGVGMFYTEGEIHEGWTHAFPRVPGFIVILATALGSGFSLAVVPSTFTMCRVRDRALRWWLSSLLLSYFPFPLTLSNFLLFLFLF